MAWRPPTQNPNPRESPGDLEKKVATLKEIIAKSREAGLVEIESIAVELLNNIANVMGYQVKKQILEG